MWKPARGRLAESMMPAEGALAGLLLRDDFGMSRVKGR
jgi:hypothetical protein